MLSVFIWVTLYIRTIEGRLDVLEFWLSLVCLTRLSDLIFFLIWHSTNPPYIKNVIKLVRKQKAY